MRNIFLLFVGLIYCLCGSTLTYISVLLITRKLNDYMLIKDRSLPDLLLYYIPEYVIVFKFTEGLIVTLFFLNIFLLIFHSKRSLILKRTLVIFGTIFFLRFFTLMATYFPIPNNPSFCPTEKYDKRGFKGLVNDLRSILLTFGLMNTGMVSCGDSMFSGHSASIIIFAGNFAHYVPKRFSILQYIVWISAAIGLFCILASHMHYTMDVVVGIWISRHVFTMYYQIVFVQEIINTLNNNTQSINTSNHSCSEHIIDIDDSNDCEWRTVSSNYLYQCFGLFFWLNPIFAYFEKDATYQDNVLIVPQFLTRLYVFLKRRQRTFLTFVKFKIFHIHESNA